MRIEQLEYVQAVTRLGSLRRVAEELHVSQPALSETLRNLERELGVELLDRRRSGARISAEGRELLPYIAQVVEAVDSLRRAADEQHRVSRMVRVGTVSAATVSLVLPAIREFRESHAQTQVEVVDAQQGEIHIALREGSFDLGLVNYLRGDDLAPEFHSTELLRGRPVVCVRADSRLARLSVVGVDDLLGEPLIVMRSGYVMHRFVHRLLDGRQPLFSYSVDGAEMGKIMVANGLGATILPDYSIQDDPLETSGVITWRPLDCRSTEVLLVAQRRKSTAPPQAARALHDALVRRAGALGVRAA
ncbi:LysR family transcriptional regulator [Nocardia sp. NPDC056000]|uniref:LysR family transcriptional regulator n=1 Tax=Nocardia sp. NPDC056000 TaxID=3345674 RepID=UPI0035DCFD45